MPEGLRRLVALLFAVILVVAALIWRSSRNDDKNAAATTTTAAAPVRVICATELETVCKAVFPDATIEPAGTTADKLTRETPPDVWLTLDPWPTVVATRRSRASAQPLTVEKTNLASTRVGLVGPSDRLKVMQAHCVGLKVWTCIGDMSGQEWSAFGGQAAWRLVKPAYFRPDLSASGYAVFANAVVAKLGGTTFSNQDLEGIAAWGRHLEAGVPTIELAEPTPLQQLVLTVPRYDLIGVLEAEVPQPLKTGLDVLYPDPVANVAVIAMTRSGYDMPKTLTTVLQQNGWTTPAAASSGLPDPALADAVLAFWKDVKGQ